MRAILISDHAKWCSLMMNGEKTIEIRKNKALANVTQKLIEENGYAEFYVYCSKDSKNLLHKNCADIYWVEDKDFQAKNKKLGLQTQSILNGKVVFKFRCYNVEEILIKPNGNYYTNTLSNNKLLAQSCLSQKEIFEYTNAHISKIGGYWFSGYAIHISDLEIFDRPRELGEFKVNKKYWCDKCPYQYGTCLPKCEELKPLTKAPKSYQFIESEK